MSNRIDIPVEKIKPNRYQPRTVFDEESLFELSQSIRENGLIQPIVVREMGDYYEIIAGERRYRAMLMAGYQDIPSIISNIDDEESATLALIENIQRENLSVLEEAKAYRDILRIQGITQKQLANQVGKSQSSIANKIRLLELSDPILEQLGNRKITERHARAMLGLETEKQQEILQEVIGKKLNVAQTEALINKPKKRKPLTKGISGNIKIGINTINQSIGMIEKTGIPVNHSMQETEDEVIITIRFKK
ncbi:nucleoid occlusion protein [Erysipelothrix sp. HDW6A]|uniref:nucleoid occlusion protein n=1 Tax=Erysipelothrix sp. HDW6A TaxID=2714928 RepID=UPI00140A0486|nr:nucleoid occlusion protein [Erysipelothrix sp. HDW6A]QIK56565.1 nucleoid occlusion protein [Erysipelothrix sp. HDW6A]